jgi:sugar phosphate isomerase/epimerase
MIPSCEIGSSTYCCIGRPLDEALELLAARTGLVEILSDSRHNLLDNHEVCHSYDLRYTVHAPGADLNIACDNETVRKAVIRVIAGISGICDEINAERLVIHPGFAESVSRRMLSLRSLERSLADLARLQQEFGVTYAIENLGSWDVCHFRTPEFLHRLDALDLGFVLDVGHAHLNGCLAAFLANATPCHVHLHDNCGLNDDHAGCGSGGIDFERVMQMIPEHATVVVEARDLASTDESLEYLRHICR